MIPARDKECDMSSSTSSKRSADDPVVADTKDSASGANPPEAKGNTGMTGDKDGAAPKSGDEARATVANQNETPTDNSAASDKGASGEDTVAAGSQNQEMSKEADKSPEATETAAAQTESAGSRDADDDTVTQSDEADEEEETLDLRALFASSEPDFAEPIDTFEAARSAKAPPRADAEKETPTTLEPDAAANASGEDTASPFVLPDEAALNLSEVGRDQGARRAAEIADRGESPTHASGAGPDADGAATPGDPLADAVQSALRSVYGDAERDEDSEGFPDPDVESSGSGPVLQWASTASQHATEDHHREERFDDAPIREAKSESAIDEETTEAVLSYLYEHVARDNDDRRAGGDAETALSSDSAAADVIADAEPPGSYEGWSSDLASGTPGQTSGPLTAGSDAPPPISSDGAQSAEGGDPAHHANTFQQETFHAPVDLGIEGSEASGKLLGAAGLGLIGGIAAAGVVAVFVFNSFVTEQGSGTLPTRAATELGDSAAPDDTQAGADTGLQAENQVRDAADADGATGAEALAGAASPAASEQSDAPAQQTAAASGDEAGDAAATAQSDAAAEKLEIVAGSVSGRTDQPIPLALSVPQSDRERFVRIDGLPEGVKLSAGVDTGNGSWLLSADRANDLALTSPDGFSGVFTLEAEVLGADARTPVSNSVRFEVSVEGVAASNAADEARPAALDPATAPAAADQPPALIARARSLLKAGDVLAAREMLRVQAENGNADAALALGESYDPITFSELTSPNASPDATAAFRWYMRAADLGEPSGRTKMSELKSWLLR